MNMIRKTLLSLLYVMALVSCQYYHPPTQGVDPPKPPPVFTTSTQNVIEYQDALVKYISYLEQYYISIGVYYGGDTRTPMLKLRDTSAPPPNNIMGEREFRCRVVEHIFKDIELPPPPRTMSKDVEKTINHLIDHIVDLRKRIRANNTYMESLRQKYKECS